MYDLIVIGGGAAGIFAAINAKRADPGRRVAVLEKTNTLLAKVRVSGGGRCNVTHSCFDPYELVKSYPRGHKELMGPFHTFGPKDTIAWFEEHGVKLKTEKDGRMFPISNSSQTIIDCLLNQCKTLGVEIHLQQKIDRIEKDDCFVLGDWKTKNLLLATGSSKKGYEWAKQFGHTIQDPIPSLFTFNVPTSPLKDLSGIAVPEVKVTVGKFSQVGPLLITHFGFSGPAILKLSAFAARYLHDLQYKTVLKIDWLTDPLPKRLMTRLKEISVNEFLIEGKTTNKEEFVTCGGITLSEVNFKTMESRRCPGLFFAGEILDIDGITGGFNFQNAWTTAYLASASP